MFTEDLFGETKGASFSRCGTYRYKLWREWDAGGKTCVFIGLNPSTADEFEDDNTIRRCISYAREWGYGRLEMVNLFALRSTNPKRLYSHSEPIGKENDVVVVNSCRDAELVVGAWGNHGSFLDRASVVTKLISQHCEIMCLKITAEGHPIHPLYQPKGASLINFTNVE